MNQDEIKDFNRAINNQSFSTDDFLINENDLTNWTPNINVSISENITVRCKSTGKVKVYDSGNDTYWVVDFMNDLELGEFN